LQRELARLEPARNEEIGPIAERCSGPDDDMKTRLAVLQGGVQSWCEAKRRELTDINRAKYADLTTGEVRWSIRPWSGTVRDA
ncbi:host-nuclease inhibitor Gam family protein, partial [Pseudomonas aeruginosa]